jgi:CRISPR-associated protein Csd2
MSDPIKNRYEFVYLFDVTNGNPNGDPDAGNAPRQDFETGKGLVTDVCIKRKIRNYVDLAKKNLPPYEIHVREGAFLSEHHKRAHLAIENETIKMVVPEDLVEELKGFEEYPEGVAFSDEGERPCLVLSLTYLDDAEKKAKGLKEAKTVADKENPKKISPAAKSCVRELFVDSKEKKAAQWMCKNFFDVRTFGAVMSTGDTAMRCGQIRGPVQLGFAESIDPIVGKEIPMSRTAAVNVDDPSDKGLGARKSIVPYGLYRIHGYVSAPLAERTGFSDNDVDVLWTALKNMFDVDPAAARTGMYAQKLIVFKHASELGNAPAQKLFNLVKVEKNCGDAPPRSFEDYTVAPIDPVDVPSGVELIEML